jgi:predicted tellurium resistance membrane protein TerC
MNAQVKFVLFILGVLFIASGLTAAYFLVSEPVIWWKVIVSLCIAFVFYIGFVNTLMEVE